MARKKAEQFKALGVESRIRIIELLKQKGSLCVNELSEALGISPSAISQHLKVLKYAGLVKNERKGYWIHYEVDPVALEKCNQMLSEVCMCDCKGREQVREEEVEKQEDEMALLKKYEGELERELSEIRSRMREAKSSE